MSINLIFVFFAKKWKISKNSELCMDVTITGWTLFLLCGITESVISAVSTLVMFAVTFFISRVMSIRLLKRLLQTAVVAFEYV